MQSIFLRKIEGNEILYISNIEYFPLFTKRRLGNGGTLTEEVFLKLDFMSYKALQEDIIDSQISPELFGMKIKQILQGFAQKSQNLQSHEDTILLQVTELLFYVEGGRWPGALVHNTMFLDLLQQNVPILLTDLPMSQPGVLNKSIDKLRYYMDSKYKNEWFYDYRRHKKYQSDFTKADDLDNLFFQGLELRLLILWRLFCTPAKFELSPDQKFLVEILPALFAVPINAEYKVLKEESELVEIEDKYVEEEKKKASNTEESKEFLQNNQNLRTSRNLTLAMENLQFTPQKASAEISDSKLLSSIKFNNKNLSALRGYTKTSVTKPKAVKRNYREMTSSEETYRTPILHQEAKIELNILQANNIKIRRSINELWDLELDCFKDIDIDLSVRIRTMLGDVSSKPSIDERKDTLLDLIKLKAVQIITKLIQEESDNNNQNKILTRRIRELLKISVQDILLYDDFV